VAAAGWKASATIAIVAAALGAGGGAATHAWLADPPPAVPLAASAVAAATAAPADVPTAPTAAPAASSAATQPAAPSAPRDDRAPGASSLRTERLLLERANAALMRGDHASALAALRHHAAAYPKGQLAEERNVLLAQATRAAEAAGTAAPSSSAKPGPR
jgi:TolA-binding protein